MGAVASPIPRDFTERLKRLMGLKFAPADLTTHWEGLRDLADEELDAAIARAQRECEDFPSPKMLRAFVDEYRRDLPVPEEDISREVPAEPRTIATPDGHAYTFTREWKYFCESCSDTGRRSFWCGDEPSTRMPWLMVARCRTVNCEKLRRGGYAHEWVTGCGCADTNPDVIRKRAQAAQVTRKQADR
jgi:hypothetical protein